MEGRPDKKPGHFKEQANQAGNTLFVKPELVRGTLNKAFELYEKTDPGLARAIFTLFAVTEIHPFIDGNGRVARIMMNCELNATQQVRIIIPTVYREEYLLTLKRMTRQLDPKPFVKMLERAQQFTLSIDFNDYDKALRQLKTSQAFLEPHEGKLIIQQAH